MCVYLTIGWYNQSKWTAYHVGLPHPGYWCDQWTLQIGHILLSFQVNREDQ